MSGRRKDNKGKPIIFDGIDLSDSLLGTGPGKRDQRPALQRHPR
jgi:hypothetical protein